MSLLIRFGYFFIIHYSRHYLFDAVVELVAPEAVHDGGGLEEDAPEERHAARRVEVHQLGGNSIENLKSQLSF